MTSVATYFHTTAAAGSILRDGFRDSRSSSFPWIIGVYLSERPLDGNEGATGDELLAVDLPDDVPLDKYEIGEDEDGKPYREWCVPAAIVNTHGQVHQIDDEESE